MIYYVPKCDSPAGQPLIYPRNDLTYTENFLHMLFAVSFYVNSNGRSVFRQSMLQHESYADFYSAGTGLQQGIINEKISLGTL